MSDEAGELEKLLVLIPETTRATIAAEARRRLKNPDNFKADLVEWQLMTLEIVKRIAHGELKLPMKGWAQVQLKALDVLPKMIDDVYGTIVEYSKSAEAQK